MTDRELLELAAKAAGIKYTVKNGVLVSNGDHVSPPMPWNPLDDDGEAFRLGVDCHLFDEHAGFTYELVVQSGKNTDHYAATRRAIVRAAAEIGRAME